MSRESGRRMRSPLRRRTLAVALGLLCLTGGCLGLVADEPTPKTVESRLDRGPTVDTVRGNYTVTETVDGETRRASVRVWTVAGERVRREIRSPDRPDRILVANGSRTWVYFPESGEAYRKGYTVLDQTGVGSYSYAALMGNLDAYRIEYRGRETVADRPTHHVRLGPAENGTALPELEFYTYHVGPESRAVTVRPTRVDLWLDAEHWYPLKHELRVESAERSNYTTTVTYDTVAFNESVDPSRFDFDPASRNATEVVMDDIATTYRPFETVAGAEARTGIVYGVPRTVGRYDLDRVAAVESADGRMIKGLYIPSGVETSDAETRITRPTHPDAVTVTVSPDGTYRELTGLSPLDGDRRTVAGTTVEFGRLDGRWIEVTFVCDDTRYSVVGNENVGLGTIEEFVDAVTCT